MCCGTRQPQFSSLAPSYGGRATAYYVDTNGKCLQCRTKAASLNNVGPCNQHPVQSSGMFVYTEADSQ
eukprot:9470639-Pyramimonas_sp.AAC.1